MADTKCKGCKNPVGEGAVKIGGYRYHDDCARQKPRYRQRWTGSGWKRLGIWSDEENETLKAHSG